MLSIPFHAYFAPYGWMSFYGIFMQWRWFRKHKTQVDRRLRSWR